MIIGVPKEIKIDEHRVSMTPAGVRQLATLGHQVRVETGAGNGSGFTDEHYSESEATIVSNASEAWDVDMVVKVKEPQGSEYNFLKPDLILFTYLHLAADEVLTRAMMTAGTMGIAYETVEENGSRPLLTPMSEIAGRMSVQVGAHYLERMSGGRGILLGTVPGVTPAQVVVIGGGIVGTSAAKVAVGMGAQVTVIDTNLNRLRYLGEILDGNLITLSSNIHNITEATRQADLVVGAVLVPDGGRAPTLVTRQMISDMKAGSVVIDVAIDQGGCMETTRLTTHSSPTFIVDDVTHYCVANMPGAVPRTSTEALSNATLPYITQLAVKGVDAALRANKSLTKGVNTMKGNLVCRGVADAFHMSYTSLERLL